MLEQQEKNKGKPEREMKKLSHSIFVVVVSILLCGCVSTQPTTRKFVMPGSYDINLNRGEYWIWTFTSWKSQNIAHEKEPETISLTKLDDPSLAPKLESFIDRLGYRDRDHEGVRRWRVNISKSGNYRIAPKAVDSTKYVLVVSSKSDHSISVGSDIICEDLLNDSFEKENEGIARNRKVVSPLSEFGE